MSGGKPPPPDSQNIKEKIVTLRGEPKRAQKGRETCPFRALDSFNEIRLSALERMAGTTRLELATSAVTVNHWRKQNQQVRRAVVGNRWLYRDSSAHFVQRFVQRPL